MLSIFGGERMKTRTGTFISLLIASLQLSGLVHAETGPTLLERDSAEAEQMQSRLSPLVSALFLDPSRCTGDTDQDVMEEFDQILHNESTQIYRDSERHTVTLFNKSLTSQNIPTLVRLQLDTQEKNVIGIEGRYRVGHRHSVIKCAANAPFDLDQKAAHEIQRIDDESGVTAIQGQPIDFSSRSVDYQSLTNQVMKLIENEALCAGSPPLHVFEELIHTFDSLNRIFYNPATQTMSIVHRIEISSGKRVNVYKVHLDPTGQTVLQIEAQSTDFLSNYGGVFYFNLPKTAYEGKAIEKSMLVCNRNPSQTQSQIATSNRNGSPAQN
jgi:hypothetical protein